MNDADGGKTVSMDVFSPNRGEASCMVKGEKTESKAESDSAKVQRTYKDSLFSLLYSNREAVLDLYLTLHPEDGQVTESSIELINLESYLLANRYNDVAFKVGNRLMILVEHQSSINENMPFRMLLYVANEYEKILKGHSEILYKKKLFHIPMPEFYVVYGGEEVWNSSVLRLSDAFICSPEEPPLELNVKIISREDVQIMAEMGDDSTLNEYFNFMEFVKKHLEKDRTINRAALLNYIEEYDGSEVFWRFLHSLEIEEVRKMFAIEYDEELEKKVLAEESREEGETIGEIKILLRMGQSKQAIIEYLTTREENPLTTEQAKTALEQFLTRKRR